MFITGLVLAIAAALIHVLIFKMESISWTSEKTLTTFNMSPQQAANTKEMAFNQGFYNLFLAIEILLGAIIYYTASHAVGLSLMFFGTGSMLAAATLLFITSPDKRPAALKRHHPATSHHLPHPRYRSGIAPKETLALSRPWRLAWPVARRA